MIGIENKISNIKSKIAEKFFFSRNPVILWSGGLESTVILFLARQILANVHILQFRSGMRPEQLKFSDDLIKKENLKVFVYQPFQRFVVPSGNSVALVEDYSIGSGSLPLVRDVVHDDDHCLIDTAKAPKTDTFPFPFDTAIVGWLEGDKHEVLADFVFSEEIPIGDSLFFSPLVDYTKEEIREIAEHLNIPLSGFYQTGDERLDTGNFLACSRCFTPNEEVFCPKDKKYIKGMFWEPDAMLNAFRERLN